MRSKRFHYLFARVGERIRVVARKARDEVDVDCADPGVTCDTVRFEKLFRRVLPADGRENSAVERLGIYAYPSYPVRDGDLHLFGRDRVGSARFEGELVRAVRQRVKRREQPVELRGVEDGGSPAADVDGRNPEPEIANDPGREGYIVTQPFKIFGNQRQKAR